jgi:hypothetical protein
MLFQAKKAAESLVRMMELEYWPPFPRADARNTVIRISIQPSLVISG